MRYTSVAEIFEVIDGTRQRVFDRVEGLTPDELRARPNETAWSVAEIVEHLSIIEDRLLRMMTMMLTKAEGAGGAARPSNGPVEIKPFTLDHYIEKARNEKYSAPEALRPSGSRELADSLWSMRRSREELKSLRPRIEATDLSVVSYPHPAFGPLNFYEWLAFIGLHEERHLHQIESALAS
ncbi:MAG TPA: DinB family protein [Pyrinomonadaceae bacterium]